MPGTGTVPARARQYFPDRSGKPLVGGSVEVLLAGTTTRTSSYQDRDLTALNPNPVPLNDRGECVIWLAPTARYKFIVRAAPIWPVTDLMQGVIAYTEDNVLVGGTTPDFTSFTVDKFSGTGVQKIFTLSVTPSSELSTSVHVAGTYIPKNAYTVVGNTLTFATAPAVGTDNVEVVTTELVEFAAAADQITQQVGAASDSATAAAASEAAAAADAATAVTARTDAQSARDASYASKGIYTGASLAAAKTAGLAGTASGQLFAARSIFDHSISIWLNSAGTAVWQEDRPFGTGEAMERIKAVEGATLAPDAVPADLDYDSLDLTADGRYIRNRAAALAPSKNGFQLSTGEIRFGTGMVGSTTTVTTRADGNAARVQFAGANVNTDQITLLNAIVLPAGVHTFKVKLKSFAGKGAQNVQFWESVGATTSSVALDESGYVERSFSLTANGSSAYTVRIRSLLAGTDFYANEFMFYEEDGNASPAFTTPNNGHIKADHSYRGVFRRDGMLLDMTNSVFNTAVIALPSFPSTTAITDIAIMVVASVDDVTQDNTAPVISADPSYTGGGVGTTSLVVGVGNSSPEGARNNGAITVSPTALEFSRINIRGEGVHIWGGILSGSRVLKFIDGLRYYDNVLQAWPSITEPTLLFGSQSSSSRFKGKILGCKVWINRGVTWAQMQAQIAKAKQQVAARGLTMGRFRDVHFAEGDSRSWNSNTAPNGPGWNHQLADHEYFGAGTPSLKSVTLAWGGSVLGNPGDPIPVGAGTYVNSTVYSRLPDTLARIQEAHALGVRVLFSYLCDVNDSLAIKADVNAYVAREKAYLSTIKAALDAGGLGSRLFIVTGMPIHTDASYETPRAALNTARRGYPALGITDGVIDFAADATLGTYSATTAPTGFIDTVHINQAGSAIAAGIARTAMAPYRLY